MSKNQKKCKQQKGRPGKQKQQKNRQELRRASSILRFEPHPPDFHAQLLQDEPTIHAARVPISTIQSVN